MNKRIVPFLLSSVLIVSCMEGGSGPADIRPAGSESSAVQVFRGIITANQIDVSSDDGSLLPERLNVGDEVYIIFNPQGGKRQGWIRVSRSPDDTAGIGWVERKSVRSYGRYQSSESGVGGGTVDPSISMPLDSVPLGDLPAGDVPAIDVPIDMAPLAPSPGINDIPLDQIPLQPIPDNALPTTDDPLLLPQ